MEQHAKGIRMGVGQIRAITLFLQQHGILQMLKAAQKHLQHHSWNACALSDALLASKLIYPHVMPDSDYPDSATTSDDVANDTRGVPPGTPHGILEHSPKLSGDQG